MRIGLIIIATNLYRELFLPDLLSDVKKFFLTSYDVEIFVFSDKPINNVTWIPTEHRPWPWMTLGRYNLIKSLPHKDYYYYIDADSRILKPIEDEILTDRLAVSHCGFRKNLRGTPETNSHSLAYISPEVNFIYCHGGFQGGKNYLEDATKINDRINEDYNNGIIAKWHDESHWNRYLIDNPPTVLLPNTYCCHKHVEDSAKIWFIKKDTKTLQI